MKCLLLLFFAGLATSLHAQTADADKQEPLKIVIKDFKGIDGMSLPIDTVIYVPRPSQNAQQQLKPGVHRLPQDNMPCIVPYTKDIVAMPNAMPRRNVTTLGKIPNAAKPRGLEDLKRKLNDLKVEPSR